MHVGLTPSGKGLKEKTDLFQGGRPSFSKQPSDSSGNTNPSWSSAAYSADFELANLHHLIEPIFKNLSFYICTSNQFCVSGELTNAVL